MAVPLVFLFTGCGGERQGTRGEDKTWAQGAKALAVIEFKREALQTGHGYLTVLGLGAGHEVEEFVYLITEWPETVELIGSGVGRTVPEPVSTWFSRTEIFAGRLRNDAGAIELFADSVRYSMHLTERLIEIESDTFDLDAGTVFIMEALVGKPRRTTQASPMDWSALVESHYEEVERWMESDSLRLRHPRSRSHDERKGE